MWVFISPAFFASSEGVVCGTPAEVLARDDQPLVLHIQPACIQATKFSRVAHTKVCTRKQIDGHEFLRGMRAHVGERSGSSGGSAAATEARTARQELIHGPPARLA